MKKQTKTKKIILRYAKIPAFILKVLLEMSMVTIDTFTSRPTYQFKTINYKKLWNEPLFNNSNFKETKPDQLKPRSISAALQRLQKQGLVIRANKQWTLTKVGKSFAESVFKYKKFRNKKLIPLKDGIKRIVIFDIPETEKNKRDWIRGELAYHGYEALQKSVWIGTRPLLPELIKAIDFLGMSSYVHIFSVKDEGTISS